MALFSRGGHHEEAGTVGDARSRVLHPAQSESTARTSMDHSTAVYF